MLSGLSALAQISLFFASLVVLYMIFRVIERIVAGRKNGNGHKSGERSVEEWEGRMRKLNNESEGRIMDNMEKLMASRTGILVKEVTMPIVNEIRALRDDLTRTIRKR